MGLLGNNMRLNLGAQQSWCTVPANTQGDRNNFSVHTYRGIQDGNTTVLAQRAVPLGSYPEGTYYPPEEVGQMAFRPSVLVIQYAGHYKTQTVRQVCGYPLCVHRMPEPWAL